MVCCFFFFKQKTAYEMRISDWSSDVCSSDLQMLLGADRRIAVIAPVMRPRRPAFPQLAALQQQPEHRVRRHDPPLDLLDRKSVVLGKSVSVRVDLGGRRIIKNKNRIN